MINRFPSYCYLGNFQFYATTIHRGGYSHAYDYERNAHNQSYKKHFYTFLHIFLLSLMPAQLLVIIRGEKKIMGLETHYRHNTLLQEYYNYYTYSYWCHVYAPPFSI